MPNVPFWGEDEAREDEERRARYASLKELSDRLQREVLDQKQPVSPPSRDGVFVFGDRNMAESLLKRLDEKNIAHRRQYKDGRFRVEIDPREFDRLFD